MKIVCQKCSATYAIDDKFVTPKGVRAQCPRCKNLQLVKRDDAAPAAAAAPAPAPAAVAKPPSPAPAANPFAAVPIPTPGLQPAPGAAPGGFDFSAMVAPPVSEGRPPNATPFQFDLNSAAPPAPAPQQAPAAAAPAAPAAPAANAFAFDFEPPPAGAATVGAAPPAKGNAASLFDFSKLEAAPAVGASPLPELDFDPLPPPPPKTGSQPQLNPVPSPPAAGPSSNPDVDAALQLGAAAAQPNASPPATSGTVSQCKTCGKALTDPLDQAIGTCDDCRAKAAAADEPIEVATETKKPAPKPAAAAASASAATTSAAPKTAGRTGGGEGRGKTIGIAVGILALVGVAGWYLNTNRPWVKKAPPLVVKQNRTSPKQIDAMVVQWKAKFPELEKANSSEAAAHAKAGEGHLMRDTTTGYHDAEIEFEKAVVLDSSNDDAIAGWALAVAFGRPDRIDEPEAQAAEAMLIAAEQRGGSPRVYVAHAHFLLARDGNANDITVIAERGRLAKSNSDKALASLAVGQAQLKNNPVAAEPSFAEALQLDPKLRRAMVVQARLDIALGRYKAASDLLQKRLELDADQWEASAMLARLQIEVGDVPAARKTIDAALAAAPKNGRAKIAQAQLAYQHLQDTASAIASLKALAESAELDPTDRPAAWLQLGTAQRIAGDLDGAIDSFDRSIEADAHNAVPHIQKFLALLDKGVTSQARLEFDGFHEKYPDQSLVGVLEGRLLAAENRIDEAIGRLAAVVEKDSRRVDALLLAGSLAATARKDGKAWEFCLRRAMNADPYTWFNPALADNYVRGADVLKNAAGAFIKVSGAAGEDPNPFLCEGLIAWHSDNAIAADKHFSRVNVIDGRNVDALSYRALLALKRRDIGTATTLGARAADARTHALAHYALGQALLTANKVDAAKAEMQTAAQFGPALFAPKVALGDIEARQKNPDDARKYLNTVLLADPLYRDAKRALFKNGL